MSLNYLLLLKFLPFNFLLPLVLQPIYVFFGIDLSLVHKFSLSLLRFNLLLYSCISLHEFIFVHLLTKRLYDFFGLLLDF